MKELASLHKTPADQLLKNRDELMASVNLEPLTLQRVSADSAWKVRLQIGRQRVSLRV